MPRFRLLSPIAIILVLGAANLLTAHAVSPTAATTTASTTTAAPAGTYTPPAEALLHTDPHLAPHAITHQLVRLADATPATADIEVSTYFLGSDAIEEALAAAFRRGVHVRVILAGLTRDHYAAGRRLATLLNRDRTDPSWLHWSSASARGTTGIDHQKIYRFSRVGQRSWVTVVGSMNSSTAADLAAYSEMLVTSDKSVYLWFERSFRQAQVDRPVRPNPLEEVRGQGWSGYVYPTATQDPTADPVMRRLRSLPATRSTVIHIAMYSMWDTRGRWIARRLARMARHGARISVLAGPTVLPDIVSALRRGGVRVHGGCFPDGTFVHSKDMTATFVRGTSVRHWSWIGSDNWTSRAQDNDEAVLGVQSALIQREFLRTFSTIWDRPGALLSGRCHPRVG